MKLNGYEKGVALLIEKKKELDKEVNNLTAEKDKVLSEIRDQRSGKNIVESNKIKLSDEISKLVCELKCFQDEYKLGEDLHGKKREDREKNIAYLEGQIQDKTQKIDEIARLSEDIKELKKTSKKLKTGIQKEQAELGEFEKNKKDFLIFLEEEKKKLEQREEVVNKKDIELEKLRKIINDKDKQLDLRERRLLKLKKELLSKK